MWRMTILITIHNDRGKVPFLGFIVLRSLRLLGRVPMSEKAHLINQLSNEFLCSRILFSLEQKYFDETSRHFLAMPTY